MKLALAMILMTLAGCGGKKKGNDAPPPDPAAANAAIPAAWKSKLEFTVQKLGDGKFTDPVAVAAPKGWKPGFLAGTLEPPEGNSDFGFGTTFRAGGSCGGDCKAKSAADWEAAANTSYFGNVLAHKPAPKIIKDEKTPGRRVMIAKDQHTDGNMNPLTIIVSTWQDDGERFWTCSVELGDKATEDLAPAFEKACLTLAPSP